MIRRNPARVLRVPAAVETQYSSLWMNFGRYFAVKSLMLLVKTEIDLYRPWHPSHRNTYFVFWLRRFRVTMRHMKQREATQ